jgi:uncharacterized heparinase superfamily protein
MVNAVSRSRGRHRAARSGDDVRVSTQVVGERWRLAWLLARHGAGRTLRALSSPVRRIGSARSRIPERLVIAPQDLRTTDPTVANDIYAGYFAFAGKVVATTGRSPFEVMPPTRAWADALAGFGWLRHLRAADSALARANARTLVDDWITLNRRPRGPAWSTVTTARRLMSWLTQSPIILEGADRTFYRKFMRSIAQQAAWLARSRHRDGTPDARLAAQLALAYVGLCTAPSSPAARRAFRALSDELDRQILPDGGHVTRNPRVLVEVLTDLLPLRKGFVSQGLEMPRPMLNAIDRIMPMLRLFRHGDGSLALFNGMSATAPDTLATLLANTDARSQAIENAPQSGYQRLQGGQTVVVMDAGPPPPQESSTQAHAGCLSFELSHGIHRIVVNCGAPPPGGEQWREISRATAAHSTATLDDTSSCRFMPVKGFGALLGPRILSGPRKVPIERGQRDGRIVLQASHDGYRAAFGIVHERRLALATEGGTLVGRDDFIAVAPGTGTDQAFALRFHLHPMVRPAEGGDGRSATLTLPQGETWIFDAGGLPVQIDDSIFFAAPDGARRTQQLVVTGLCRETATVTWRFRLAPDAAQPDPTPTS